MTAMWKPGTSKPQRQQQQPMKPDGSDAKSPDNNESKQPSKKLSTATMGMRFMQRKSLDSNKKSPAANKKSSNDPGSSNRSSSQSNFQNESSSTLKHYDDGSATATATTKSQRKRDIHTIITPPKQDPTILLEMATVVDIYGTGSDLIGRRSFGGFHKSIGTTWEEAYRRRTESDVRKNHRGENINKISDEELLRRYERYVKKGREKSGVNDEKKRKRKAVSS